MNQCSEIKIQHGEVADVSGRYDIIVANINRNVLLHDLAYYAARIHSPGGKLLVSGFYRHDEDRLIKSAEELGFTLLKATRKNDWSSLLFEK
ncbi:MAG: hypothetical protein F6K42_27735 [Leptolyngbya sp. SIO1D8]|nr:hypothetical protein [Leptolyngbya sp. SIO1D8]